MKTLLRLFAAAAAFGMVPAAAAAQAAAPAPTAAAPAPPTQPNDAIGAASQAAPAQPQEFNARPDDRGEEPSDAQVLQTSLARTSPESGVGQPTGKILFQPQVTAIGQEAVFFHNMILLPLILVISLFVLILLLYVVVRYRRGRNPVPSRSTHNTALEVMWTLVPVLILVAIAIPSIRLLANKYSPPAADLTVKVTGNQWFWTYSYPDHGDFEIVSNMLKDEDAAARGEPRLLGVDNRMVVPVGKTVKVIITAADVIHSWGVPAFWVKLDAVPGRLNETWFKVDKPGVYYGQCFELCGARHAYMPIAVEVVPEAQFAAWVGSQGGTMPGTQAAAPTGSSPQPTAGGSATETSPAPTGLAPGTAAPPVSGQGATESRRGSN